MSPRSKRWLQAAANIALVAVLLTALSFLPPDNSLADVRRTGVLRLCVPESYPPLVQQDPEMPGYDIELAGIIAEELGVRLAVNVVTTIGKDFNPRNWRLTRSECNVIAGGVADTIQTRNFLQTIPTGAETGWVGLSRNAALPAAGSTWAVWPGTSGLDRLALSSWLRAEGVRARRASSARELQSLLMSGEVDGAITERFMLTAVDAKGLGYEAFWLPADAFARYPMALGLWKGDQTLFRAILAAIRKDNISHRLSQIANHYGVSATSL